MTIRIRMAHCSERGERSGNEDNLRCGESAQGFHAVLADGAGGHRRGAEAALRAVTRVAAALQDPALPYTPRSLDQAIHLAHADVRDDEQADTIQHRMHATVVALWLDAAAQRALWSHVGDSRLYRVRHGRAQALTEDDSVVQRLLKAGLIDAAQARSHPQRNQLLAALGSEGELEPHTLPSPAEVLEGDAYLLCSDGWWDHFEPQGLADTLQAARTPDEWLQTMAAHIAAQRRPRQDNYSAIALWVGDPADVTQPLQRPA